MAMDFLFGPPLFGAVCVYAYYFMIGESKMLLVCVCL